MGYTPKLCAMVKYQPEHHNHKPNVPLHEAAITYVEVLEIQLESLDNINTETRALISLLFRYLFCWPTTADTWHTLIQEDKSRDTECDLWHII